MRFRSLLLGAVACVLGGCDKDPPSAGSVPPSPLAACSGHVAVTVGASTTPAFSWTPACAMSDLAVTDSATGAPLWAIAIPSPGGLVPGIRYAATPAYALERATALPLQAGKTYQARVEYVVGGDVISASGSTYFRP